MFDIFNITGSFEREETTTHVVNFWRIPGGTDYTNATPVNIFYSDEEAAKEFCAKWDGPPEMPSLMTIEQYDEIVAASAKKAEALENAGN